MMKSIKKGTAAIGLLAMSAYQSVWAALPTPVAPKAEWAEVGVLGIVGAIVLIFASYLLTEAAGVI